MKLSIVRKPAVLKLLAGACSLVVVTAACADTLFSDAAYEGLVADPRARLPGETLTVLIYEQASSATSAARETERSLGFAAGVRGNDQLNRGEFDGTADSEGGGTITRRGQLIASVSVSVDDVTTSGELLVSGEQLIEFNEERQYIKLSGRVRPEDISADNTVISSRLADARISYMGDGLLGRQQRPGFLTRLFNRIF